MSSYSEHSSNVARILQRKGDTAANAAATKGQIWGETIATLGDVIPQRVRQTMELGAQRRKAAQIQQILGGSGGDITPDTIRQVSQIDPEMGLKLGETYARSQKAAFDYQMAEWDFRQKETQFAKAQLADANSPEEYAQGLMALKAAGKPVDAYPKQWTPELKTKLMEGMLSFEKRLELSRPKAPEPFTLGPGDKRYDGQGALIAEVPANQSEGGFSLSPGGQRFDAKGNLIASVPDRPGGGAALQLVPIIGPDGKPVLVPEQEAIGKTPASAGAGGEGGGVKLSAGQQQEMETMLTLSDMSKEVLRLGDEIGWEGVGSWWAGTRAQMGSKFFGAGTDEARSLRNNLSNIQATIAKLRGGASFTPTEQALLDRYTPTINDGDADIKQKLKDLNTFIDTKRRNALKVASGDLSPNPEPLATKKANPFRK